MENYINSLFSINHALQNGFKSILDKYKVSNSSLSGRQVTEDVYKRQLQTVHGHVEHLARTSHKQLAALLHIPGLYRLVPGVFVKSTRSVFGPAAGFAPKELQTGNGVWRVDMMKCPYHDTCAEYGCPELCRCFCDSDDISYTGLHPKLIWERSMTLGRGNDRCDFCMKVR